MEKINKVAIFGVGTSGKSAIKLANALKLDVYVVNKGERDTWYYKEMLEPIIESCSCYSEDEFAEHFHKMDMIVISPGIPTSHPALAKAVEKGVPIISEIEFAYQQVKDVPVIAITGTNGKTTTTTMITEALKMAGKNVFCGGNIGVAYCEMPLTKQKYDYAVIEVSSFQLETIQNFHPHIGLILNIFPNHSERYDHVHDYAQAKFNMLKNMTSQDHLILGTENEYLAEIKDHPAHKSYFTKGELPEEFKKMFSFKEAKVKGEHNEANFYAAYETLKLLGIQDLQSLFQTFINEFKGVAHRLEYVMKWHELEIYNDAKSTNTLATTTAIKAFKDDARELHLILGGKLRNEADKVLPDLVPYKNQIKTIFTIGDVTDRLYEELKNDFNVVKGKDLKNVFEIVKGQNLKGNLVFSPAFPSFDQFKNYVNRGELFKQWAREAFH
jgi:UDP-N-acetylmuramoylalanine--D-glutamate ligase